MSLKDSWVSEAECAKDKYSLQYDFTNWFSEDVLEQRKAQKVCKSVCPVQFDCAQHALFHKEHHGVWGGMDEFRVRQAVSIDEFGNKRVRVKDPVCPNCLSKDVDVAKKREKLGYLARCTKCEIKWYMYRSPEKTRRALARKEKRLNDNVA